MSEPRPTRHAAHHDPFAAIDSGEGCPPLDQILLAVAGEFGAVDGAAVEQGLDALALPLFGIALAEPGVRALRLGRTLEELGITASQEEAADFLLPSVVERRRGHPLLLSALACELARRAGAQFDVLSAADGFYAGTGDGGSTALLSLDDPPGAPAGADVRCHCPHEVAYASLLGLEAAYESAGSPRDARRAAWLRSRLPVERYGSA